MAGRPKDSANKRFGKPGTLKNNITSFRYSNDVAELIELLKRSNFYKGMSTAEIIVEALKHLALTDYVIFNDDNKRNWINNIH